MWDVGGTGILSAVIRRWWSGTALTVVVSLVAGCGPVRERADAAAGTASRLLSAVAGRDGPAACALLAPETVAAVADAAGTSCARAILDEQLPGPGAVTSAVVYGQWAQVRVGGDTMFLAVFGDGWRVSPPVVSRGAPTGRTTARSKGVESCGVCLCCSWCSSPPG